MWNVVCGGRVRQIGRAVGTINTTIQTRSCIYIYTYTMYLQYICLYLELEDAHAEELDGTVVPAEELLDTPVHVVGLLSCGGCCWVGGDVRTFFGLCCLCWLLLQGPGGGM